MRWGIFSLSQIPDQRNIERTLDEHIEQFKFAEELGYDSIWLAEHLFSTYGCVTSGQTLMAAVARVTSKVRIGSAVSIIPFNHPLRTAGDFSLVDILSHGRLDFGVGRAYQPHEFQALGLPMDKSREMFDEGMDIILKAWTNEKITYDGQFWKIPEPTELIPKPIQKPHPPVWMATVSPESFDYAAKVGYNLQMAAPFSYRIYREEWREKLAEQVEKYEGYCEKYGRDPKAAKRMMLVPLYCEPDAESAKANFQSYVSWFYAKVAGHQLGTKQEEIVVPGYEVAMSENIRSMKEGYLEYQKLAEYGAICASDPDGCADYLIDLQRKLGVDEFVLWTNLGGIPDEKCRASMKLVAEQVIPKVEAATVKSTLAA